ncbi:hypothetical protein SLEP1_g21177 [Rubroshorea leprosula]|uniref:Uncharacterized protein n=1 Tax=Rubroshorea leprosula TaxID=152421 RepID=A0AAV5JFR2_9ROSI|nr:hypothetical protein SLEP1_g21177 [Rubroshorea leprosula]
MVHHECTVNGRKLGKFGFEDEQWTPTRTFLIVEEMGKAKWTPPTLDVLTC